MDFFEEYFTGYFERTPEGFMSWQHLTSVTIAVIIAVTLAIWLSRKNRKRDFMAKLKVVKVAAILIDGFELTKLILFAAMEENLRVLLSYLPLFLCSIPLIVLPVAAFSRGRVQKASLDFMVLFGMIAAVLGTYMAANIYSVFPVLHFQPVVSLITHMISGFAGLYILLSGLATFEKKNSGITIAILGAFMATAAIVNVLNRQIGAQSNYMFLSSADGTPFVILENIFGTRTWGYGLSVALVMWVYMLAVILIVNLARRNKARKA